MSDNFKQLYRNVALQPKIFENPERDVAVGLNCMVRHLFYFLQRNILRDPHFLFFIFPILLPSQPCLFIIFQQQFNFCDIFFFSSHCLLIISSLFLLFIIRKQIHLIFISFVLPITNRSGLIFLF